MEIETERRNLRFGSQRIITMNQYTWGSKLLTGTFPFVNILFTFFKVDSSYEAQVEGKLGSTSDASNNSVDGGSVDATTEAGDQVLDEAVTNNNTSNVNYGGDQDDGTSDDSEPASKIARMEESPRITEDAETAEPETNK